MKLNSEFLVVENVFILSILGATRWAGRPSASKLRIVSRKLIKYSRLKQINTLNFKIFRL